MGKEGNGTKRFIIALTVPIVLLIGSYAVGQERISRHEKQLTAAEARIEQLIIAVRELQLMNDRLCAIESDTRETRDDVIKIKVKLGIE